MNQPLLDLVRERIGHGLDEARNTPIVGHIGEWFGVIDKTPAWTPPDGLLRYINVAAAGAAFAATGDAVPRDKFSEGINWLRQRRFFVPNQPPGLEADPVALLGLALGLDALDAPSDSREWLCEIGRTALGRESDASRRDLLTFAVALAENSDVGFSELSPLIQVALAKRGGATPSPDTYPTALRSILGTALLEPEWAVIQAAALDALFSMEAAIDPARLTSEKLVELLRRVPAALKRWPWENKPKTQHAEVTAQCWDIQHEYHVQSLLWALLRPVVPGLEDEENLPSLGHKHPRADLLIPALRVLVEVKYLRGTTQSARAKIIEEVAADTGLYLTSGSGYDRIVAFVWDATGSTHHHDELAAGLGKLRGIADVVIVARPGEWKAGGAR